MKQLLLIAMTMLWGLVTPAHAERLCYVAEDLVGKIQMTCEPKPPQAEMHPPCRDRMEAAMRAMDPFIMTTWFLSDDIAYRKRKIAELREAERIWFEGVKCWRGQP